MNLAGFPIANWIQLVAFLVVLLLLGKPLGLHMAAALEGEATCLTPLFKPFEHLIYRIGSINPAEGMSWKTYAKNTIFFSFLCAVTLFLMLFSQNYPRIPADVAFNITASFITGTNWQSFIPEITLTFPTQMLGLAVHNFLSAAVGLAVMMALIRGLTRSQRETVGNFWADIVRSILYILLPICLVFAALLVGQGVVQTFGKAYSFLSLEDALSQFIITGPVASQTAIKQLGTNGGGYYLANAAHPFENPTPLSNFIQMIGMVLLPIASAFAYGKMANNMKQGTVLLITMLFFFIPMCQWAAIAEHHGNPFFAQMGIEQTLGNMEGKELRIGATGSTLWAAATTATSNGATNAAIDSFSPIACMNYLLFIQLGETIFGGVGSGLFVMLIYVLLAVFIAGLMIGRSPRYLGKAIGVFDIQMASLVILIPTFLTLAGTALAVMVPEGQSGATNPGAHGFSQILFGLSSASNTNGSSLAGLRANSLFYNVLTAVTILIGRYGTMVAVLAIAGSMAAKYKAASNALALDTTSALFIFVLATVIIINVLAFLPSVALGPLSEQFHLLHLGGAHVQ